MDKPFLLIILAVVCIVLGIINCTGNISTIKYHQRKRVPPEKQLIFGRIMGAGTIIIGVGFILGGIFFALSELLQSGVYSTVGGVILIVGVVVGLVISFAAMFKYNKGIF